MSKFANARALEKVSHAHRTVANVAMECCEELYETVMSNNLVYDEWKRQHPGASDRALRAAFVARNWPKCIPMARATLGLMLREPLADDYKERIVEALALDQTLMRGRQSPAIQMGEF